MSLISFFKRVFPRDSTVRQSQNVLPGMESESGVSQTGAVFEDQEQERFDDNMRVVSRETAVERSQKTAEREVRVAAEQSLKRQHILQRGRCPLCSEALRQHSFISVCVACGWSTWSTPKEGGVKVHLTGGGEPVAGDAAYVVKDGVTVVRRGEFCHARLPAGAVSWIEYAWTKREMDERKRSLNERLFVTCGWCNKKVDTEADGFHLIHVAFGTTQERYCMCSDECYEAFRKMYPARIHRNCYDRDCEDCTECMKRYQTEGSGMRSFPKDFLTMKR